MWIYSVCTSQIHCIERLRKYQKINFCKNQPSYSNLSQPYNTWNKLSNGIKVSFGLFNSRFDSNSLTLKDFAHLWKTFLQNIFNEMLWAKRFSTLKSKVKNLSQWNVQIGLVESPCWQTHLQHLVDLGCQFALYEILGEPKNYIMQVTS